MTDRSRHDAAKPGGINDDVDRRAFARHRIGSPAGSPSSPGELSAWQIGGVPVCGRGDREVFLYPESAAPGKQSR